MSLTALPPEIIGGVVAQVDSRPTLYRLARCSRQLYSCTIPYLYHHVTIQKDIKEGGPTELVQETFPFLYHQITKPKEIKRGEHQTEKLRSLASLLIRRPDLAGLVRHFTLRLRGPPWMPKKSFEESDDAQYSKALEESDDAQYSEELEESVESKKHANLEIAKIAKIDQALKTAVKASSMSKREENNWLRLLSQTYTCHHDVILALLLPALFKLETLVLDLDGDFQTKYLERMMRRAACRKRPFDTQPRFEALTAFVHDQYRFNPRSTELIASLLRLSAVKEISAGFANTRDRDLGQAKATKDLVELESFSSPVTSLNLATSAESTADLGHMLRAPKALKTLFYKICLEASIDFEEIRHALEPQKKSLECLGLDYDADFEIFHAVGSRPTIREYFGPMTSFISFNAVKVFKIAALFLETIEDRPEPWSLVNIFPPNIETLHLTHFQAQFEQLLDGLEQLLAEKSPPQIPSLKKLILESTRYFGMWPVNVLDVLRSGTQETAIWRLSMVAAARGVTIEVIEDSRRCPSPQGA